MPNQQIHEWVLNTVEGMANQRMAIVLLAVALHATGVRANDTDMPDFSFSSFGTVGVVHATEDRADFTSTTFKPNGAGHSHSLSADPDSLIGGQITAHFTPELSAILQVISEQNFDNSYQPHVEWANIKYQFTPDFNVRVGRTALPVFMETDSRKIGYANPWVRPPIEVYNLVPLTSNDGIDASYRLSAGALTNTLQVDLGRSDSKFPAGGGVSATIQIRRMVAFVDTFEQGFATLRLSYGRARLTIPELEPLFDAFRQFGPEGIAIADKYGVKDRLVTFIGIGASYDPGVWFVRGEWGHVNTRSAFGENTGWYVSSGYRVRQLTPYVTYAAVTQNSNGSDPGLTISALPPGLAEPAAALNASLNARLGAGAVQQTISVGGRWDFAKNMDLKLQFDHMRPGAGSIGTLVNVQPDFRRGGNNNVLSVAFDFVF